MWEHNEEGIDANIMFSGSIFEKKFIEEWLLFAFVEVHYEHGIGSFLLVCSYLTTYEEMMSELEKKSR